MTHRLASPEPAARRRSPGTASTCSGWKTCRARRSWRSSTRPSRSPRSRPAAARRCPRSRAGSSSTCSSRTRPARAPASAWRPSGSRPTPRTSPPSGSSLSKGESFIDTARNIEAMGADVMVVRHPTPGTPHLLAQHVGCSIINAGDGAHEHPTQGLLDLMTIRRAKGRIEGLTVGLLGDIAPLAGRPLEHLGPDQARGQGHPLRAADPGPQGRGSGSAARSPTTSTRSCRAATSSTSCASSSSGSSGACSPRSSEYSQFYMMTQERLRLAKDDLLLLAPGPDQPRRRADPGGRRRPALGHPRPGDQRPGRADGRALPAQWTSGGRGPAGVENEAGTRGVGSRSHRPASEPDGDPMP